MAILDVSTITITIRKIDQSLQVQWKMESIQQLIRYCLLFWYDNERNWSIVSSNSIIKPRREPDEYKEGDLVLAKFKGKPYNAAIVRVQGNKDDLREDHIKLENLLKDATLSPSMVMQRMGVEMTKNMDVSSVPSDNSPLTTTPDPEQPAKKRKSTSENGKPPKKSTQEKQNKSTENVTNKELKQQNKEKQLAAIEASRVMARKLLAFGDSDVSVNSVVTDTTQNANTGSFQSTPNFSASVTETFSNNQSAATAIPLTDYEAPTVQPSYMINAAYNTISPSYTELLNGPTDSWNTGMYAFDQHSECNRKISFLEEEVKRLSSRIEFLEGKLLEDFLTKLYSKVPSTPVSTVRHSATMVSAATAATTVSTGTTASDTTEINAKTPSSEKRSTASAATKPVLDTPLSPQQMVDLVPGYGIQITSQQMNACIRKARGSPTALARLLLVVFFDNDTLSRSCARGTTNRAALNPDILDAIIRCCVEFSNGKTSEKDIVQAINGKCSDARQTKATSVTPKH